MPRSRAAAAPPPASPISAGGDRDPDREPEQEADRAPADDPVTAGQLARLPELDPAVGALHRDRCVPEESDCSPASRFSSASAASAV